MKNKLDHLLFCLGEECGEVQQVVGKAGRFGIDDINPNNGEKNIDLLETEIHHIVAAWIMVCEEVGRDSFLCDLQIGEKKAKVLHFMKHAEESGNLSI